MKITTQFWNWCLQKGIMVSAEHLPGRLNVGANQESRAKGDSSDWRLNPTVFQNLMSQLGPCQVDLFASRLNAQLESYMSWKPDPGAIATDALSLPWTDLRGYVFPPFSLIGRCLSKIQHEKVPELILIAPVWPIQPWYPVLKASVFQKAILLPPHPKPSAECVGRTPSQGYLTLATWPVSGLTSRTREFQSRHQPSFKIASWRKNTEAAYSCSWRKWQQWCSHHGFESVCAPLSAIIEFLSCEFAEGKQYRTLNAYRSAILMTHQPIDGVLVQGSTRLFAGCLKAFTIADHPSPGTPPHGM